MSEDRGQEITDKPVEPAKPEKAAAPAAPAVNGAEVDELTIPLRKNIQAHGEELTELKFREPTAGDIDRIGNPIVIGVQFDGPPKITFDTKVMTQMMSHLAAIPPSSVRQMHPKDWNNAAWMLMGFFTPDM